MIFTFVDLNDKIKSIDSYSKFNSYMLFQSDHASYNISSVGKNIYSYFNSYSYTIDIYNKNRTSEGTTYYCTFTNHYSITRSKIVLTPKIVINPEPDNLFDQTEVHFEFNENKFENYKVELWNIGPGQSVYFTIYITSKMRDEINKKVNNVCEKIKQSIKEYNCDNTPIYFDFKIIEEKI